MLSRAHWGLSVEAVPFSPTSAHKADTCAHKPQRRGEPVVDQKAPERTTPALRERLARRKPIEKLVSETNGPEAGGLRRHLGFWHLSMIGIGATLGTGIFVVLGEAVPVAGPAVTLSFVLAGLTALFSALALDGGDVARERPRLLLGELLQA